MDPSLPTDSRSAALRRRELLSNPDWLTADEAQRHLGGTVNLPELQGARQLLGVWDPDKRHWRYPAFQFKESRGLREVMAELLAILPPGNGSGWSQIEWLYSPHPRTLQRRPVEFIASDPEQVLSVARAQFDSHPDAHW